MAFSKFNTDVNNISALDDKPNKVGGLSAAQLKAKFDKAGADIKNFINSTLLAELEGTNAAGNIGISSITGISASTVQGALAALKGLIDNAGTNVPSHASTHAANGEDPITVAAGNIATGAITREKLAANAVSSTYTATIPTTGWPSQAPYTRTIDVDNLLSTDNPIVDIKMDGVSSGNVEDVLSAFSKVYRMTAGAGTLTVYALEKPSIAIPLRILCIRR